VGISRAARNLILRHDPIQIIRPPLHHFTAFRQVTFELPTTSKPPQMNFTLKIERISAGKMPILPLLKTVYVWLVYGGFLIEVSLEFVR
jgi:hypothetical protein